MKKYEASFNGADGVVEIGIPNHPVCTAGGGFASFS